MDLKKMIDAGNKLTQLAEQSTIGYNDFGGS